MTTLLAPNDPRAGGGRGRLLSEGKILEITPLLYDRNGTLSALPPTVYRCPSWLLGYMDHHIQGYPYHLHGNERMTIPGTDMSVGVQLGFQVRIYEDQPGIVPEMTPAISQEWCELFAQLVRKAVKNAH